MKDDDGHAQAKIRTLLRYAGRRVDMHGEGRGMRPREERARQLAAHHVQRKRDVQALELPDHCLDDVGVPVSSEKQLARQEVGTVQGQVQAQVQVQFDHGRGDVGEYSVPFPLAMTCVFTHALAYSLSLMLAY